MDIQELLNTLVVEFEGIRNDLGSAIPALMQQEISPDQPDAAVLFAEQLDRCMETVTMLELHGLAAGCSHAAGQARALPGMQEDVRMEAVVWQDEWLALCVEYLSAPDTPALADRMALHLANPRSGAALPDDMLAEVRSALAIAPTMPPEFAEDTRTEAETIDEADASLSVPDDVDAKVYDAFLSDSPGYASQLSKCVSALTRGESFAQSLKEARRIAHSLKGSANIVGIKAIGKLAHRLEDVLDHLATLTDVPELPEDLQNLLLDSADALEQMVAALSGEDSPPTGIKELLQRVCDWAFQLEQGGLVAEARPQSVEQPHVDPADVADVIDTAGKPLASALVPAPTRAAATASSGSEAPREAPPATKDDEEATLRVPLKVIDQMFRHIEGLSTRMAHLQLSLKDARERHAELIENSQEVTARILQMEELVHQRSPMAIRHEHGERIDPLELNQYSELQRVCRLAAESSGDYRQIALKTHDDLMRLNAELGEQDRFSKDLQYLVGGTRMLPLSALSARLERAVRQTCRATGKQAVLHIHGAHVKVDSDVLNKLAEPLMHLLRNAIDHGIEPAEQRAAAGKDRQGHLRLQFSQNGQAVEVRCIDDGRGYDYDRIRARAVAVGLIASDAVLSEHELAQLTMRPGFTTSSAVTEVSGRGVGMDIVQARIQALHGNVVIKSRRGEGTEILLQFQASLVTLHLLLVRVGTSVFAVPSHIVELAIPRGSARTLAVDGKPRLAYLKSQYHHHRLSDLVGMHIPSGDEADDKPALLIRRDSGSIALTVDELLDSQQLIVKKMGTYLQGVRGVLGAVMRADGTIAPLLDIPALLDRPADAARTRHQEQDAAAKGKILVVDDSPSVRQSLSLLLEDAGYAVVTARDGRHAITLIDASRPDVVLTDLEMPVLNGLELTQHLRARPDTADLPIVMITSRSTDKHRRLAEEAGVSMYLTKPYNDDELLDVVGLLLDQSAVDAIQDSASAAMALSQAI